jgi:hypothetical protein
MGLLDATDVEWSSILFSLTKYEPEDITDFDKATLTKMLNNIFGVKTVKN